MNSDIHSKIFKSALMFPHRNKLEKGTYVNFQILGKFMKVSRKFLKCYTTWGTLLPEKIILVSLFTDLDGDVCILMLVYTVLDIMARYQSMISQKWCMAGSNFMHLISLLPQTW